jgi:hypothetical protein
MDALVLLRLLKRPLGDASLQFQFTLVVRDGEFAPRRSRC